MKIPALACPHAEYRDEMRIYCKAAETYCGNVYFKSCKGWWVLTDNAGRCPLRKGDKRGAKHSTAPNRGN